MNTRHPQNIRGRLFGRRLAALARPLVCLTLAVFALGIAPGARAAQYYFSATGNDSTGNGSQSSPWRSLAKASSLTNLTGGDQVLFKRGDVWTGETLTVPSSGTAGNPITFGAYGSGPLPIFDGNFTVVQCVTATNKSYLTIQDLEARNAKDPKLVDPDAAQNVRVEGCHHVTVQRVTARNASHVGILVLRGFENHVLDCTAISNGQAGIFFKGSATDRLRDSSIQRCFIDGDNLDTNDGIALHDAASASEFLGENFIVRDNLSINCFEQGYDITSGGNILAENNVSQGNRQGAFSFGHNAHNVTVRYHRSENEPTESAGSLKVGAPNVTVEYSTFVSNGTATTPLVWVTSTTGADFPEVQPDNLTLRNNVFVWNHATVGGDFFKLISGAYPLNISTLTIKNNIFVSRTSQGGVMRFANSNFPPNHAGFTIDNNLYYGSTPTQWVVAGTPAPYNFATYRSTFGKDTNGVQADPQFEGIANGNFHLSPGSPAIDAGTSVVAVPWEPAMINADFSDPPVTVPQGAARDIGAFEFPTGGSAPAAPSALSATAVSPTEIDLAWTDNSGAPGAEETQFEIFRSLTSGSYGPTPTLTTAGIAGTGARSFADTTVAAATTYFYKTRAVNSTGASGFSNEATAQTPGGGGTPIVYEAESQTRTISTPGNSALITVTGASGGPTNNVVRFTGTSATATANWIEYTLTGVAAGTYSVKVRFHKNAFRAKSILLVDDTQAGAEYDGYAATAALSDDIDFGNVTFTDTANRAFRFQVTGLNGASSATDWQIAADYIKLTPQTGNTAPTISDIAGQTIDANGNTGALAFTVGDAETAAGSLTVSGSSSNATLVPNGNIVFGGSGANRTVTVTPATGQSGTAAITVTVSDGSLTAQDTFVVTVNPIVSVSATDASAAEAGLDPGTFTFTRVGSTATALTVNFTVGGTAASAADYTSIGTSVTFNAGSATATKTVTPLQDTTVEGPETVIVTLAGGTGYTVGSPSSATVTIADNDTASTEAATTNVAASSGDTINTVSDALASGGNFIAYLSNQPTGDFITFNVDAPASTTVTYAVTVRYHKNAFRGIVELYIDGSPTMQGSQTNCYVPTANKGFVDVPLGTVSLAPGNHTFKFVVNGHDGQSGGYQLAIDTITLAP